MIRSMLLPALVTGTCQLPIDIMFLQDITASFEDDLPMVKAQIPAIVTAAQTSNPGSKFGVAAFRDKPYWPFGDPNDTCYIFSSALESESSKVLEEFAKLGAGGGSDLPEAQYTALISLTLDERVGWRPIEAATADPNKTGARLIILSTDALPHMAHDADKISIEIAPDLPRNWPEHWGGFTQDDPDNECLNYDYPDGYLVRDVLQANNIFLGILLPDDDATVVGGWKWINEDLLGQDPGFLRYIQEDSSDIAEAVANLIHLLTDIECAQTTQPPVNSGSAGSTSAIIFDTSHTRTHLSTGTHAVGTDDTVSNGCEECHCHCHHPGCHCCCDGQDRIKRITPGDLVNLENERVVILAVPEDRQDLHIHFD